MADTIEKIANDIGMKIRNVYSELEPYFTKDAKHFLDMKIDSTILEYDYYLDRERKKMARKYCVCKYIGCIIDVPFAKLKIEDIEFFARFINKAVDERIFEFGVVSSPIAIELENEKTLLRIYAHSNYTNEQLNTIIQIGLGFGNISAIPEGGKPDDTFNKDNLFTEIYNQGYLKGYLDKINKLEN